MSFQAYRDINYLIQHLKHEDIHLYEALSSLNENIKQIVNVAPVTSAALPADEFYHLFFGSSSTPPPSTGTAGGLQWVQEHLTGVRDGSNVNFTLTWEPATSPWTNHQIVIMAKNGYHLSPFPPTSQGFATLGGDYTLSGKNVTMTVAPGASDVLIATYFPINSDKPPTYPPEGEVISARVYAITRYVHIAGAPATAWLRWNYGAAGGNVGGVIIGPTGVNDGTTSYATETDFKDIGVISDWSTFWLRGSIEGTLSWTGVDPGNQFFAFDMWLRLTYANGVQVDYRPNTSIFNNGSFRVTGSTATTFGMDRWYTSGLSDEPWSKSSGFIIP